MTMARITYISRNYKSTRYGGGKARVDMEDVLCDMGAVNLGLPRTFYANKVVDYFRNLAGIIRFMASARRGDTLVLQYPVKKYFRLICRVARLRGVRTIALIHDLGSFRRHRLTARQEISKLSLADAVIAANANTVKWLRDHGFTKPATEQVAWDFLSEASPGGDSSNPLSVLFVGGLKPGSNGFLYKLPAALDVELYGNSAPEQIPANCHNNGFGRPDDIIAGASGRYGLIWYGTTLEHDDNGYIGEYIAYCNSHKLGLYMRAGKPVVMWKGAGAAPFVEREGIGLTVDSLADLDKVLAGVTPDQYAAMLGNVRRVAARVARGDYFREALDRLGVAGK